jgi:hypothetical protein
MGQGKRMPIKMRRHVAAGSRWAIVSMHCNLYSSGFDGEWRSSVAEFGTIEKEKKRIGNL